MEQQHGRRIQSMFDRISPRYDLLNRLISMGQDMRWRKKAVALLGDLRGKTALDLCCGTGDFLEILRRHYREKITLVGADFAGNMLRLAHRRLSPTSGSTVCLCQADALHLPFADNSFAGITMGFGIRNILDRPQALREILRTLHPGGGLTIIEPNRPAGRIMAGMFSFYFKFVMPLLGGIFSGDRTAYRYLYDSATAFPTPDEFLSLMRQAGFVNVRAIPQTLGTAILYFGEKAA